MSINVQPRCGAPLTAEGTAFGRTWAWIVAAAGTISGIVGAIGYAEKVVQGAQTASTILTSLFGSAAWNVAGSVAAVGGALLGVAIGLAIVFSKALDRRNPKPGVPRCYAGVVNGLALAFTSGHDWAFPYAAEHDRLDLVVKRAYWPLVDAAPRQFVWCAADVRTSPLIRSYFHSQTVRNATGGAMAGAIVGGIGGAIAGYFAGVGVATALGAVLCSASLWFYLLCLLVVIVVALVVALICTLVTATIGGAIGAGATNASSSAGPTPRGGSGGSIALGDYVTLNANLAVRGEDSDAWVAWWVDESAALAPAVHGRSMVGEGTGGSAPFNFVDADGAFIDACPT